MIFEKFRTAAINNGITQEAVSGIISAEWFIPQKQQLGLV